ncbi:MAG: hypothetical protein HY924_01580 [Elusimicrobia bacterium]|nr:hypothetical protein [Elusimicrobiota bacterium]
MGFIAVQGAFEGRHPGLLELHDDMGLGEPASSFRGSSDLPQLRGLAEVTHVRKLMGQQRGQGSVVSLGDAAAKHRVSRS